MAESIQKTFFFSTEERGFNVERTTKRVEYEHKDETNQKEEEEKLRKDANN